MSEHRRDLVTGRWVIISSPKGKRAEDFRIDLPNEKTPPDCPFCHGNESLTPPEISAIRSESSRVNGPGWQVRVIPNRNPVLRIEQELTKQGKGIYDSVSGFGAHEIVVDSPQHARTMRDFSEEELHRVLGVLQTRHEDLYRDKRIKSILMVKSEGPLAGAYFSHPYHQVTATPIVPQHLKEHLLGAKAYFEAKDRCVYCDILREEKELGERVVYENDGFIVFCPYASRFPFEMWVMPKMHGPHFYEARFQTYGLAQAMRIALKRLAVALGEPQFTYTIYTAPNPTSGRDQWRTLNEDFHWHIEILPCLSKSIGFERSTGFPVNPTPPEEAAKFLRDIPVQAE